MHLLVDQLDPFKKYLTCFSSVDVIISCTCLNNLLLRVNCGFLLAFGYRPSSRPRITFRTTPLPLVTQFCQQSWLDGRLKQGIVWRMIFPIRSSCGTSCFFGRMLLSMRSQLTESTINAGKKRALNTTCDINTLCITPHKSGRLPNCGESVIGMINAFLYGASAHAAHAKYALRCLSAVSWSITPSLAHAWISDTFWFSSGSPCMYSDKIIGVVLCSPSSAFL